MSSKDVAYHMTSYDWELFHCVHEVFNSNWVWLEELNIYLSFTSFVYWYEIFIYFTCLFYMKISCFSSASCSLNSSITHLGDNMWRKPLWTWTCSWGGSMKFSFGWSLRCVCVLSWASEYSFLRSLSRLLPSMWISCSSSVCSLVYLPH